MQRVEAGRRPQPPLPRLTRLRVRWPGQILVGVTSREGSRPRARRLPTVPMARAELTCCLVVR